MLCISLQSVRMRRPQNLGRLRLCQFRRHKCLQNGAMDMVEDKTMNILGARLRQQRQGWRHGYLDDE